MFTLDTFQVLLADQGFERPNIDWHAVSPELVLLAGGALVTLVDVIGLEKTRRFIPMLTGLVFLAALIPIVTLFQAGDLPRTMFDSAYIVDGYSLVLKVMFLLAAYVVVLMGADYLVDGDYYDSEFYQLIMASVLGAVVLASSRDFLFIFLSIELVTIPAYMMAAWRKKDLKSNEAGLKYMLMGVFASSILLFGVSWVYGTTGSTNFKEILSLDIINGSPNASGLTYVLGLGTIFVLVGLCFKVSAVPFHTWAPDTYEGAPTPLTAYLAVVSKAAGFVGLIAVVKLFVQLNNGTSNIVQIFMWVIAAITMTVGNLIAMRQQNIVRMLAYSGIAQAGYMLAPFVVVDNLALATSSIVNYLLIYSAMNLGAFTVVIIVARRTGSGDINSYAGLFKYAPGLAVAMTLFLFSLIGLPPTGGFIAKFRIFEVLLWSSPDENTSWMALSLAVLVAVNSVIAAYYYLNVVKQMWFMPALGDDSAIKVPISLKVALILTLGFTLIFGLSNLAPALSEL